MPTVLLPADIDGVTASPWCKFKEVAFLRSSFVGKRISFVPSCPPISLIDTILIDKGAEIKVWHGWMHTCHSLQAALRLQRQRTSCHVPDASSSIWPTLTHWQVTCSSTAPRRDFSRAPARKPARSMRAAAAALGRRAVVLGPRCTREVGGRCGERHGIHQCQQGATDLKSGRSHV